MVQNTFALCLVAMANKTLFVQIVIFFPEKKSNCSLYFPSFKQIKLSLHLKFTFVLAYFLPFLFA